MVARQVSRLAGGLRELGIDAGPWCRGVVCLLVALALVVAVIASAAAAPSPSRPFGSTDAILKWINDYRHKPEPEQLPAVVHALSAMQAFKDAESSGAY